jgi:ribosomal protein L37AE/L43A
MDEEKKCPYCGSIDVRRAATYVSGAYKCGKCGFIGPLDLEVKKPKKAKEKKKEKGNG